MYTMHTRDILQPLRVPRDGATHGVWPSAQQRLSWRHGPGGPAPQQKRTLAHLEQGSLTSESSSWARTSLRPAACPFEVRARTARSRRKRESPWGFKKTFCHAANHPAPLLTVPGFAVAAPKAQGRDALAYVCLLLAERGRRPHALAP